jgi:hypothetical protein
MLALFLIWIGKQSAILFLFKFYQTLAFIWGVCYNVIDKLQNLKQFTQKNALPKFEEFLNFFKISQRWAQKIIKEE